VLRLTKVRVALAGLALAGGAAAATILGPAGPAVGQSSPAIVLQIQVNSPATLVAKGAAVEVSVTTLCSGAVFSPSVQVFLTESIGGKIATGQASFDANCNGNSQTTPVLVTAEPGKAFKKGVTVAVGFIDGCGFNGCQDVESQATIAIS
jgi:hypothetical protein